MLTDLARAILELGLPVAALTWLLYYRLYSRGVLSREADGKAITASLKSMREKEKASRRVSDSLLHAKWMKFGGGFYGVATVWTLIFIEISGVVEAIMHPSAVSDLFGNGVARFIARQIQGQIMTLIDAAIWFTWWPDRGHGIVTWVLIAYGGYIAGLKLARYESSIGSRVVEFDSRERWLSMVPFRKRRGKPGSESNF